jgi:hypothetical protein
MNALQLKEIFQPRKLLCTCFGHKLEIKRNITPNFREFECSVCHVELTNDDKGKKTFLTPHLKEVNETLYNFYTRRHSHSAA